MKRKCCCLDFTCCDTGSCCYSDDSTITLVWDLTFDYSGLGWSAGTIAAWNAIKSGNESAVPWTACPALVGGNGSRWQKWIATDVQLTVTRGPTGTWDFDVTYYTADHLATIVSWQATISVAQCCDNDGAATLDDANSLVYDGYARTGLSGTATVQVVNNHCCVNESNNCQRQVADSCADSGDGSCNPLP